MDKENESDVVMKQRYSVLLLMAVFGAAVAAPQKGRAVEEGYLVAGAEGQVVQSGDGKGWVFTTQEPITDGKGQMPSDKGVLLLPCSTLEQMAGLVKDAAPLEVRVWAVVTEHRGKNYLYCLYFLPLKEQPDAQPEAPAPQESAPAAEKEKESVLPTEILQMIQKNAIPDLKRLNELVVVTGDRNLIGRTGLVQATGAVVEFKADAFGQNVGEGTFELLACKPLEEVLRAATRTPGRQRYIVSGVMTQYAGKNYLLLRRATRTFTHGNFTP